MPASKHCNYRYEPGAALALAPNELSITQVFTVQPTPSRSLRCTFIFHYPLESFPAEHTTPPSRKLCFNSIIQFRFGLVYPIGSNVTISTTCCVSLSSFKQSPSTAPLIIHHTNLRYPVWWHPTDKTRRRLTRTNPKTLTHSRFLISYPKTSSDRLVARTHRDKLNSTSGGHSIPVVAISRMLIRTQPELRTEILSWSTRRRHRRCLGVCVCVRAP